MRDIHDFDLPARLAPVVPRWATEVLCALAFIGLAIVLRVLINVAAPAAAPFALVYPAALAATLLAGWRSGALALVALEAGAWFFVMRPASVDGMLTTADVVNIVLYGAGAAIVIAVAEGFRRAGERTRRERMARLAEHDLLLQELNHRVKNNFQMVSSLLDMQRRRAPDGATGEALAEALRRVQSMAHAHTSLYQGAPDFRQIDARDYLDDLCRSLAGSLLLSGDVHLKFEGPPASLSRDRAVALGLVVNELVTNAAKYAFPDGRSGTIRVNLDRGETGLCLTVADDGVGMRKSPRNVSSGLGLRLVEAFARQAGGTIATEGENGVKVVVTLPDRT